MGKRCYQIGLSTVLFFLFFFVFLRASAFAAADCSGSYSPSKPVFNPGESITLQATNTTKDYKYEFTIAKSGTSKTICKENKVAKQNGDVLNLTCTFPTDAEGSYFLTVFGNRCVYFPPGTSICVSHTRGPTCLSKTVVVASAIDTKRCPSFTGTTPPSPTKTDDIMLNFSEGQPGLFRIVIDPGRALRPGAPQFYTLNYPSSTSVDIGIFPNDPTDHSFQIQTETTDGWRACGGGSLTLTPPPTPTPIAPSPPCAEGAWKEEKKEITDENGNKKTITIPTCTRVATGLGIEIGTNPQEFVKSIFGILLSLSGGIALLLIIVSGYQMMISQGNPEKLQGAKETLTSAIVGLLFIIFSVVILQIIGVDILKIPGFEK